VLKEGPTVVELMLRDEGIYSVGALVVVRGLSVESLVNERLKGLGMSRTLGKLDERALQVGTLRNQLRVRCHRCATPPL
jgi:hypothetical protein